MGSWFQRNHNFLLQFNISKSSIPSLAPKNTAFITALHPSDRLITCGAAAQGALLAPHHPTSSTPTPSKSLLQGVKYTIVQYNVCRMYLYICVCVTDRWPAPVSPRFIFICLVEFSISQVQKNLKKKNFF